MQATAKKTVTVPKSANLADLQRLTQVIQQRADRVWPAILAQLENWDGKGRLHIPIAGQSDDVMAILHQRIRTLYPNGGIYVFRPNTDA
jgi:hypothetical protein